MSLDSIRQLIPVILNVPVMMDTPLNGTTPEAAKIKCKNYLAGLLECSARLENPTVAQNIKALIQALVDARIDEQVFSDRLTREVQLPPQPCFVESLKKALPHLRPALASGEIVLEGINPPDMSSVGSETYPVTFDARFKVDMSNLEMSDPSKFPIGNVYYLMENHCGWELNGHICLFYSLLHISIKLSEGKTKDKVHLEISFFGCPNATQDTSDLPGKIKAWYMTLTLMKTDGEISETKHIKSSRDNPVTWTDLNVKNECFCSVDQIKPLLTKRTKNSFIFETCLVEIQFKLKLNDQSVMTLFTSACDDAGGLCDQQLTIQKKSVLKLRSCFAEQVNNHSSQGPSDPKKCRWDQTFHQSSQSGPSTSTVSSSPTNQMTVTSTVPETDDPASKYADIIVLKIRNGGGDTGHRFFAHKSLLISESPVFEAMFKKDNWLEANSGEVILEDLHPAGVECFLDYLYDREDETTLAQYCPATFLEVLKLAHFWDMKTIMNRVVKSIVSIPLTKYDLNLAAIIFYAGVKFNLSDLQFRAVQWMRKNKEAVMSDSGLEQLEKLSKNRTGIVSAIIRWLY